MEQWNAIMVASVGIFFFFCSLRGVETILCWYVIGIYSSPYYWFLHKKNANMLKNKLIHIVIFEFIPLTVVLRIAIRITWCEKLNGSFEKFIVEQKLPVDYMIDVFRCGIRVHKRIRMMDYWSTDSMRLKNYDFLYNGVPYEQRFSSPIGLSWFRGNSTRFSAMYNKNRRSTWHRHHGYKEIRRWPVYKIEHHCASPGYAADGKRKWWLHPYQRVSDTNHNRPDFPCLHPPGSMPMVIYVVLGTFTRSHFFVASTFSDPKASATTALLVPIMLMSSSKPGFILICVRLCLTWPDERLSPTSLARNCRTHNFLHQISISFYPNTAFWTI